MGPLGHSNAYSMQKILFAILIAAGIGAEARAASNDLSPPPDYRFKIEVLTEGIPQPMELELAPDGRIFFNEIGGKLKIYNPGNHEVALAGTIPVFPEMENGFLGFALDPAFANNHWIYLYYSPTNYV